MREKMRERRGGALRCKSVCVTPLMAAARDGSAAATSLSRVGRARHILESSRGSNGEPRLGFGLSPHPPLLSTLKPLTPPISYPHRRAQWPAKLAASSRARQQAALPPASRSRGHSMRVSIPCRPYRPGPSTSEQVHLCTSRPSWNHLVARILELAGNAAPPVT
ncbi:hypothetical protein C8R47DRAFT_51209 [Mycena vitilis]|nr:hypothetical protein C8R47DRAFT_51209 [Mycena vitilis]